MLIYSFGTDFSLETYNATYLGTFVVAGNCILFEFERVPLFTLALRHRVCIARCDS
jgi:hypothetical protein